MKHPILAGLVLLSAAIPLAGCGEKHDVLTTPASKAQPVSLMLDWVPNADHVGLYQAIADGDFSQAGINLHVQTPSDPASPLKLLEAGQIDAAISYEPEVLLARNQHYPLVSVAAIVQRPLTSIISLGKQKITRPAQLKGRTVGTAGIPYQHAYLTTILSHAGVAPDRVREVNVGGNLVPAMLSGRVNATLGGYWNYEALQLAQAGKKPNVVHADQAGVPTYDELVLVVKRATIATRPDLVRRLVQALARGYYRVRANPQAGVENLLRANPGLDRKLQSASVRVTLPAFFPGGGRPWGWQDQGRWNAYGQWMLARHLVSDPNAVINASTNELLAGQGP